MNNCPEELRKAEAAINIFVDQQWQILDRITEVLGYPPDSVNPISALNQLIEFYEKKIADEIDKATKLAENI